MISYPIKPWFPGSTGDWSRRGARVARRPTRPRRPRERSGREAGTAPTRIDPFDLERFVVAQDAGDTYANAPEDPLFARVLDRYFDGETDAATEARL